MIIFLNGTSSSGKSSIARAIMKHSPLPYLLHSMDHWVNDCMDEKFISSHFDPPSFKQKEWFYHQQRKNLEGHVITTINDGSKAIQFHNNIIEAIGLLARKNHPIIIDEVLWHNKILGSYVRELIKCNLIYMIKVTCDILECQRREKLRNDRYEGLALGLSKVVYNNMPYVDLVIDTSSLNPESTASIILNFIQEHPNPSAFQKTKELLIKFVPLSHNHFKIIHQWFNKLHVQSYYSLRNWTLDDIIKKYTPYINKEKKLVCSIIYFDDIPIGYIQHYHVNDFQWEHSQLTEALVQHTAGLDLFIGEEQFLQKGIGHFVIEIYLKKHIWPYFHYCMVDPESKNFISRKLFEKCGFKDYQTIQSKNALDQPVILNLMVKKREHLS